MEWIHYFPFVSFRWPSQLWLVFLSSLREHTRKCPSALMKQVGFSLYAKYLTSIYPEMVLKAHFYG